MKCKALLGCCLALAIRAEASEWRPSDEFLKAVRVVESGDGVYTVGDNGESLGAFQLSEAAWLDVNSWRKARGLKTYNYDPTVFHSYISRVYASNYITILHDELTRKLHRNPTHAELYAAYNLGLKSFAQCDYKLHRVNPVTRARCQQIAELLQGKSAS
jgi:hypothetical protein